MHDTTITVQGYAGGNVDVRNVGETSVATFRLAATPRRFDKKVADWVDAPTQWYTVKAWRNLAHNVGYSIRRGDAVIVHGRLIANTWTTREGQEVTTMEIEATMVGHDLNRGITQLQKPQKPTPPAEQTTDAPGAEDASPMTIGSLGETAPDEWLPKAAA